MRQIDVIKIYNKKRCLIIDDFPEVRGSVKRMLKTFGVNEVDTAANGEEAVALCQARHYDIVLCDYNLGAGKDGQQILEELRYLRALMNTSLFVLITAESSRQMVLGALECQPDDYITKPLTQASLRFRLDKALLRHEALYNIKAAIDRRDYETAIAQCDFVMKEQKKYVLDCLHLKAQLLFKLEKYAAAKKIYEDILAIKPTHWAKLGLGKTLLALQDYDQAEALLKSVLDDDYRYVEAYDLLSELYEKRRDSQQAQSSTAMASKVSPKSVTRHRRLARLADINQDNEVCLQSHQNAIRWGLNSCYESPQDYFNYARKVSQVVEKGDTSKEGRELLKQAFSTIERARKRFEKDPSVAVQAKLVESQVYISQENREKAQAALVKAAQLSHNLGTLSPEAQLEQARAMLSMGRDKEADELLRKLARENPDKTELLEAADSLCSEPVSSSGKKRAGELTKKGINLYDEKNYQEAINFFSEAVGIYPKHIGLNLNLVQVILAKVKESGDLENYRAMCENSLAQVRHIDADHPQFERYQFLKKQLAQMQRKT